MNRKIFVISLVLTWCASAEFVAANEGAWRATTWNDERAFAAEAGEWEAIVSVERGRLVYFGKSGGADNLLFAPANRDESGDWGGHCLWLGPQTNWAENWPPPRAWETSAPVEVKTENENERLVLTMPDYGDAWPTLVRAYRWFEGRLHCEARISGGERDAQIIHILRVPAEWEIELSARQTEETPRGYVQLHLGRSPNPIRHFEAPPHVRQTDGGVTLSHRNKMEKLGFAAQSIVARRDDLRLRIDRGRSEGVSVGAIPDAGFVTQVYLSSERSPLIELEQLSPLWAAANNAVFEIVLEAWIESAE